MPRFVDRRKTMSKINKARDARSKRWFDTEEFRFAIGIRPMPILVEMKVTEGLFYHMQNFDAMEAFECRPVEWRIAQDDENYIMEADDWYLRESCQHMLKGSEIEDTPFRIPMECVNTRVLCNKVREGCEIAFMDKENTELVIKLVMEGMKTFMMANFMFLCRVARWDASSDNWVMCDEDYEGIRFSVADYDSLGKRNAIYSGHQIDQSTYRFPWQQAMKRSWVTSKVDRPEVEEEEEEKMIPYELPRVLVRPQPKHIEALECDIASFFFPEPEINLQEDQAFKDICNAMNLFSNQQEEEDFLSQVHLKVAEFALETLT